MYQIQETRQAGQTTLLIPAMLDDHFPLLRYAFFSRRYYPVILENRRGGWTPACGTATTTCATPSTSAWASICKPWGPGTMTWRTPHC